MKLNYNVSLLIIQERRLVRQHRNDFVETKKIFVRCVMLKTCFHISARVFARFLPIFHIGTEYLEHYNRLNILEIRGVSEKVHSWKIVIKMYVLHDS